MKHNTASNTILSVLIGAILGLAVFAFTTPDEHIMHHTFGCHGRHHHLVTKADSINRMVTGDMYNKLNGK